MAKIAFSCPHCGRDYEVEPHLAGKRARCKGCQEVTRIPDAGPPPASEGGQGRMRFPCPRCGHRFSLDARLTGKAARCKDCGEVFRVPEPSAPEQASDTTRGPASRVAAISPDDGYDLVQPAYAGSEPSPRPAAAPPGNPPSPGRRPDGSARGSLPRGRSNDRDEGVPASPIRRFLAYRAKVLAIAACLGLLGWTLSALFPRAWKAGQSLIGDEVESPNDPAAAASASGDPDLDFPDFAPDRAALILKHKETLARLAHGYGEMAQGYSQMRNPSTFDAGQAAVARASGVLEAMGKQGDAIPELDQAEKSTLIDFVDRTIRPATTRLVREIRQLKATPGIKGDFSRLEAAFTQAAAEVDREFRGNAGQPSVLLTLNRLENEAQREQIGGRVQKLLDPLGGGLGWNSDGGKTRLKANPVLSVKRFVDGIDFGKVTRVEGRRIDVNVTLPAAGAIAAGKDESRAQPAAAEGKPAAATAPPAAQPAIAAGERPASSEHAAAPAPASAAGGASVVEFRWRDESGDRIGGMGDPGHPDNNKDQHLVVTFEFPSGTSVEGLSLTGGGNNRWVTQPSDRYWPLAVYRGDEPVSPSYTPRLGDFSGRQTFDLHGNTPGEIRDVEFVLEAELKIQGQPYRVSSSCRKP